MTKEIAKRSESTPEVVFEPTPHQIVWLDTAVSLGTDSPTEISKECGIDRTNWSRHKWLGQEGFYDWYVAEWKRKRSRLIPELDAINMKYAKRGSYQHLELMTKKVGDLPQDKAPSVNIQQNFNNIAQKDREELGFNE